MSETAEARCRRYRRRILEISRQVSAAHVAPAFSCLEIVDALYHQVMRPRDVFIMSKGHGCLAQYVVLEDRGVIPRGELDLYCRPGGKLGAHPDYAPQLGIHASTGSLGHGLGIAAGQALAEKLKGADTRVYCLLSDGECQEGSTWEAAMVAANLGLSNLVAVVDYNGWGGMERMEEAFPSLSPLAAKWHAFEWICNGVRGHTSDRIVAALQYYADNCTTLAAPQALVCETVKGKGVSFIEAGQPLWHYRSPTIEEYEQALEELR